MIANSAVDQFYFLNFVREDRKKSIQNSNYLYSVTDETGHSTFVYSIPLEVVLSHTLLSRSQTLNTIKNKQLTKILSKAEGLPPRWT